MELALKICRFDPGKDTVPYFQEFTVNVEKTNTVLDSLLLAWQQDPSFSFRRSCRSAICGSCAVRINGEPALACQTLIDKAASNGGPVTIEPLPHFRQLKDLVVDLEPFFESLKAALPWLIPKDDHDGLMAPDVARRLEDPATCILCGVCNAVFDKAGEAKPASLVKALRFSMDPRDAFGVKRLRLLGVPDDVLKLFICNLPDKCPKRIGLAMAEA